MLVTVVTMSGCMSARRAYPGREDDTVWTALVASAHTPDYELQDTTWDWSVTRNEVWADPVGQRIEIYRRLDRTVRIPMTAPRHEERTWRFAVSLETDDDRPPVAHFTHRGFALPMDARAEADRYFRGVAAVLSPEDRPARSGMMPFVRIEEPSPEVFVPATAPFEVEVVPTPAAAPASPPPAAAPEKPAEGPSSEPEDVVDPALLELLEEPG